LINATCGKAPEVSSLENDLVALHTSFNVARLTKSASLKDYVDGTSYLIFVTDRKIEIV